MKKPKTKTPKQRKSKPPAYYHFENSLGERISLRSDETVASLAKRGIEVGFSDLGDFPTAATYVHNTKNRKHAGAKPSDGRPHMPRRLPGDHNHVLALLDESERISALALRWANARTPNVKAAQLASEQGWAFAVAGAWLRCYLKGDLTVKPKGHLGT